MNNQHHHLRFILSFLRSRFLTFLCFFFIIFGYAGVMITQLYIQRDLSSVDYDNIQCLDEKYLVITSDNEVSPIKRSQFDQLVTTQNANYINHYQINSVDDLLAMDFYVLPGYQVLTQDGIAISKRLLDSYILRNLIYIEDNDSLPWTTPNYSYTDVVGKYLQHQGYYYKICIIYDYVLSNLNPLDLVVATDRDQFYDHYINSIMALPTSNYFYHNPSLQQNFIRSRINQPDHFLLTIGDLQIVNEDIYYHSRAFQSSIILGSDSIIIDLDSNEDSSFIVTEEEGIYIDLDLYNRIYDYHYLPGDFISDKVCDPICSRTIHQYPNHIGETLSLSILDNQDHNYHYQDNYILKGVIMDITTRSILVSTTNQSLIQEEVGYYQPMVNVSSIDHLKAFLNIVHRYSWTTQYTMTQYIDSMYAVSMSMMQPVFVTSLILTVIFALLLAIQTLYISRKKPKQQLHSMLIKGIKRSIILTGLALLVAWLWTYVISVGTLYGQVVILSSLYLIHINGWLVVYLLIGLLVVHLGLVLLHYENSRQNP